MKALTDKLEWVRLYLAGRIDQGETGKRIAIEELNAAFAIAEALPEITLSIPAPAAETERAAPERIIKLSGD